MSKPKLLVGPDREKWLAEKRRCILLDFVAGATLRQISMRNELNYVWVEQVVRDVVAKAKEGWK